MSNNRTFFKNAQAGQMSLQDIFSETFKKHTPEEKARVLIAGTPLTTPTEAEMLSGWQKPFLFFRFFLFCGIFLALGFGIYTQFGHPGGMFLMLVVMAAWVNISLLLLAWEMNVPRNISLYEILGVCAIGGAMSILATLIFGKFDPTTGAQWAPLTEEPAKALIVYLLLMKKDRKYILNGMLLGMAVGTGFAIIETLFYNFRYTYEEGLEFGLVVACLRALTAIDGHGIWAALEGGGLMLAKGKEKIKPAHLLKPPFLVFFGISFVMHFLGNSDILSELGMWRYVIFTAVDVAAFLYLLKKGVNEIVEVSAAYNGGRVTMAVNRQTGGPAGLGVAARLEGMSGSAAGRVYALPDGQSVILGRYGECDICLEGFRGVSGRHCRITVAGGQITILDLGSTNGTYVAGQRLAPQQSVSLTDGSVICLGSRDCAFRLTLR